MNRSEWRAEKRRLWWAKHDGLAGLIAGSFIIAPVAIMYAVDPQARKSIVRFAEECFIPFILAAALTVVFLSMIAVVFESYIEKKAKDEKKNNSSH